MAIYKLAICAIAKNEHFGLEEWVAFHRIVGVEHFYIYDNDSTIPVQQTLAKQIEAGYVTVINFPGPSKQMPAYDDCLMNYGPECEWLAFIDCDEFLLPKKTDYVPDVLKNFSEYGGLQVNWVIFGSNGHVQRPTGLVIESYTKGSFSNWKENLHTKAIIQPKHTRCAGSNPHHFVYHNGAFAVSETKQLVPNAWSAQHSVELIQLNHYTNKSLEDFKMKIAKGRADVAHLPARSMEEFQNFDAYCAIEQTDILRFVGRTKFLLNS